MVRHHYVPRFLLSEWLVEDKPGQKRVPAYYWDERAADVKRWPAAMSQVCYGEDLFTVDGHPLGDAVERRFFGEIDRLGAEAHNLLKDGGPRALTLDQRIHFVRFMLSLDARRPNVVQRLREEGAKYLRDGLNSPDLIAAMAAEGIDKLPADWYAEYTGISLEDDAMLIVQKLTDNKLVGQSVLNYIWGVRTIGECDGRLVLSDRPLIRINAHDSDGAVWAMPLTPRKALVASAHQANLDILTGLTGQRFVKEMNTSSALQADRYVFSLAEPNTKWLKRRLPRKPNESAPEIVDNMGRALAALSDSRSSGSEDH